MSAIFFALLLLLSSLVQHLTRTFQTARIISNETLNIEEYATVKFNCLVVDQRILAAWRINFRHDDIYRYYYINANLRQQFFKENEKEEKPRDVIFDNHWQTMSFSDVRQWINSAFESIECLMYHHPTKIWEIRTFYLNVYVLPSLYSMHINDMPMNESSIFSFVDEQPISISCELYSYPRSFLQLQLNNRTIQVNETIDCFNEELSSILLSDTLCLLQRNWRIRVRITTTIFLSKEYNEQVLTCRTGHFPHENARKYASRIRLIERRDKSSPNSYLSSSISTAKESRYSEQTLINSLLLTSQETIIEPSKNFSQENRYKAIVFILLGLVIVCVLLVYVTATTQSTRENLIQPT